MKNREIVIVDEFTGRTMEGRRWSDGLHQAVEAKELVPIQDESQTLASITYQSLFLLYDKLSGMTGTAKTEEVEFEKIYNLKVVPIPTNKPIQRIDFPDLIYKNQYIKWQAIANECQEMHLIGRPVLVGTTTIEKSELLAALLSEYNVPYQLLNAKPENVEKEALIISQAGCLKAVTISTNMAGRGTDIVLGGSPRILSLQALDLIFNDQSTVVSTDVMVLSQKWKTKLQNEDGTRFAYLKENYKNLSADSIESSMSPLYDIFNLILKGQEQEIKNKKDAILQIGGLHVIGTERHESRRIDNQLRGRSGRQGDPGSTRFFLSLEDKLLRLFGGEQILQLMKNIGFQDDLPIQSPLLNQSLENAQRKVEAYYFDIRKQLFEYDQALTLQRTGVYLERKRVLNKENVRDWIIEYAERSLSDLVMYLKQTRDQSQAWKIGNIKVQEFFGVPFSILTNQDDQALFAFFT